MPINDYLFYTVFWYINYFERGMGQRSRVLLTPGQAVEIFLYKLSVPTNRHSRPHRSNKKDHSPYVARLYGVSAKTIRDIWNRRSWKTATCHLWPLVNTGGYPNNQTGSALSGDPFHDDWPHWNNKSAHPIENFVFV